MRPPPHPRHVLAALSATLVSLAGCVAVTPYPQVRARVPAADLVEVRGRSVHAPQRGAGEPVVLLHGFGASAWSWREVVARLAPSYLTVAVDLNGFGWSERPEAASAYLREGQVDTVIAVMDALGLDSAHVVGHSYGGSIAQTLAVSHPTRVRSLVLVDTARADYPETRRSPLAALRALDTLFVRTFALRPRQVRRALERSIADDSLVTTDLVAGYLARLAVEGAGRAFWGLTRPRRGQPPAVEPEGISAPTLVVWGEEDSLIPVEGARERARRIPRSRFVTLPAVGHLPMEEAPERLSELILAFLADPGADATP